MLALLGELFCTVWNVRLSPLSRLTNTDELNDMVRRILLVGLEIGVIEPHVTCNLLKCLWTFFNHLCVALEIGLIMGDFCK